MSSGKADVDLEGARRLLWELRQLGCVPRLAGGRLDIQDPRGELTPPYRESIDQHRAGLTELLANPTLPAPRSGEVWTAPGYEDVDFAGVTADQLTIAAEPITTREPGSRKRRAS